MKKIDTPPENTFRKIFSSMTYHAYVTVLPKWLRKFKVPGADVADLMQEVWLAVCSGAVPLHDARISRMVDLS